MKLVMENWRKFLVENRDAELTDFIARTKEEFQLADLQLPDCPLQYPDCPLADLLRCSCSFRTCSFAATPRGPTKKDGRKGKAGG